ncbi:PREDICTED: loricrin-like [Nelumbo nucifera]|uniref:Loricrin-like n=1 Tax=Nelumbo nucifera TaxID=4432 RepID=A0A1U7YXN2_NELNU|nr:PREDICTED: loricrin-like [Nelumbo nucifera]
MQSPRGPGGKSGCRGGGDSGGARRINSGAGASYIGIAMNGPRGSCGAEGPRFGHSNAGRDGNEDGGKRERAWDKGSGSDFWRGWRGGGGSARGGWSSNGASAARRVQRKGEEEGGPNSQGAPNTYDNYIFAKVDLEEGGTLLEAISSYEKASGQQGSKEVVVGDDEDKRKRFCSICLFAKAGPVQASSSLIAAKSAIAFNLEEVVFIV